ncbi:MAG TPA: iron-sulfur cluster assembly scaffold protein, partial [Solirubrobacterales bacterium]|nr:iron-sulfur cluster assembly scaffold protein [Solirubrobacterales bacterium]
MWGIPVTSVARTMFDLAATRPEREVERAWNEMEVREYRGRLSVPDLIERYPGRKGTVVLARLANGKAPLVGITRNDLEEAFLALVDRFGLPRPRMNAHLAVRDRFYEVDCLWEGRKVAVELDGGRAHGTVKAFHKDRERDRILTAEGYATARITWDHIQETPTEVARTSDASSLRTLCPMDRELFDHFLRDDSRRGPAPDDAFTGAAGGAACGDLSRLSLSIDGGRISAVTFDTEGCGATRAATAAVAEAIEGTTILEAAKLSIDDAEALLGGLVPSKRHAAQLATDALHRALGAATTSSLPLDPAVCDRGRISAP